MKHLPKHIRDRESDVPVGYRQHTTNELLREDIIGPCAARATETGFTTKIYTVNFIAVHTKIGPEPILTGSAVDCLTNGLDFHRPDLGAKVIYVKSPCISRIYLSVTSQITAEVYLHLTSLNSQKKKWLKFL
jgi:hypothetical protein